MPMLDVAGSCRKQPISANKESHSPALETRTMLKPAKIRRENDVATHTIGICRPQAEERYCQAAERRVHNS